ncbi:10874_t:CDS:1, partial [Acaulospora colombiana]
LQTIKKPNAAGIKGDLLNLKMNNLSQFRKHESDFKTLMNSSGGTADERTTSPNMVNSITFYNAPFNPSVVKVSNGQQFTNYILPPPVSHHHQTTNNDIQSTPLRFNATLPAINCPSTPTIQSTKHQHICPHPSQQIPSQIHPQSLPVPNIQPSTFDLQLPSSSSTSQSSQLSCSHYRAPQPHQSELFNPDHSPLLLPRHVPSPQQIFQSRRQINGTLLPEKNRMQKEKQALRLERNRLAAKECRERRKEYITKLESRVERIEEENEVLKKKIQETKMKLELFERNMFELGELETTARELQEKLHNTENH